VIELARTTQAGEGFSQKEEASGVPPQENSKCKVQNSK
jgi:hypothetical protein